MAEKQAGEEKSEPHASYCGTCGGWGTPFGPALAGSEKRGWRFRDPNVRINQPFRRKMSLTPFFSSLRYSEFR